MTLPSGTGVVSAYTYDDADRLTGIDHVKGGSTTLAFVDYTLDDVGNRTQRVDDQGTHTYVYDDLYRLTSVTYPGPTTTTYDFDAFGNRTELVDGGGTTTYDYDDADRLVEVTKPGPTTVIYDWDDNGNLTDRDSDEFTWDFEDRMTSATVNSVTTTSTYRGDGLRNSRTVGGGSPTVFTWDIAASLAVVLDDGNQYVYGAAGLTSMKQSGDWYYYLADGLGSTMAMVDDTGTVQKSYTYDVYGEATPTGGLANEFDFAGQQTDTSTGLQYLRARYMDPETGVFISRDPLAIEPSILEPLYGYAMANPSNYTDPLGLCSWYDVSCHIKEALGLNDAEYSYCARGPFTLNRCRQARDDANSAVVIVESLFGDEDSDRTAALRHCLWSGFMTCRWGSGQAKIFGDLHEASETDPNRKKQAFWNNEVGRVIGDYFRGRANATQLIADECIRALNDGRLINDRKFFQKVVK